MPSVQYSADGFVFEPSNEELRISARIVVHIARQPRLTPFDNGLQSLTQEGMAQALQTSPASVSHAVGRLCIGGLLVESRRHVGGRSRRVHVYQLTSDGERIAQHILSSMANHPREPRNPTC